MVKAIGMPDLYQFKPVFLDLSARCGGSELEHLIIVRDASFPHGCLRLWQGSVAEAGDWLHFRMVPVPFLSRAPPLSLRAERSNLISVTPVSFSFRAPRLFNLGV